ncbi:dermonecrotic toxin domain-containing protein [Cedecea davisae]|uniref:dermonecrotic toxin domain-containing protein n=1 Tax=Cedecea davisae TaxID=158484 RepID=UPI001D0B1D15|nr:DUF6543 domain-containing protein [Cedecea davisae]
MPHISMPYQQHRRATGNHAKQQDKYQATQQSQDERIKKLARQPGLHSGNQNRQNTAHAMVNLLAVLSTVQNHDIGPAVTPARAKDILRENRTHYANGSRTRPETEKMFHHHEYNTNGSAFTNHNHQQTLPSDIPSTPPEMWKHMANGIQQISNYIASCDILKFPIANADSVTTSVDQKDLATLFDNITENIIDIPNNFINRGTEKISQYYKDNSSTKNKLRKLISQHIRETISRNLHINIDSDTSYFMCLNGNYLMVQDGDIKRLIPRLKINGKISDAQIIKLSPAKINTTLTSWLVNSHSAPFEWPEDHLDNDCGIYNISSIRKRNFLKEDELKISASDAVRLFSDFNIESFAKSHLIPTLKDKDAFIKKRFIDFIIGLENCQLSKDFSDDVLQGIGKLPGNDVTASLLSINKYEASNAFIFKNHRNGRVTLYFPNNEVKFICVMDDSAMEGWIMEFCGTRNGREQLASHFSLYNRHDGSIYYGIDNWLDFFNYDNTRGDVITKGRVINRDSFFEELYFNIRSKITSDLLTMEDLPKEYYSGLWENIMYDLNLIPNPVTPFILFGISIANVIDAKNYKERIFEYKKLRDNAVNILCMSLISEMMETEQLLGYSFINQVRILLSNDDALVKRILKESKDILVSNKKITSSSASPLNSKSISFYSFHKTRVPELNENYFLENEAYQYLIENGNPSQSHPKVNVEQGIFIDKNLKMIFSTGDRNFNVVDIDEEGIISIENRENSNKPVTKLYPYNDKYLLIREQGNGESLMTIPITECREKKSPNLDTSCTKLKITAPLDKILKKEIKNNGASSTSILSEAMVSLQDEEYPNVYHNQKNGKYYFLYDGHFFRFDWIKPESAQNPTKKEVIKLYKNESAIKNKQVLAIVPLIKKINSDGDTEIILSGLEEYLAATVNIPQRSIKDLINNENLISIAHAKEINGAVNSVLKSGIYSILDIKTRIAPKLSISPRLIRNKLYPSYIARDLSFYIKTISLAEIDEKSFSYLFISKVKILNIIEHIKKEVFPAIANRLESSDKKILKYISNVFKTEDRLFINNFALALTNRIEFINDNLSAKKIILSYIVKARSYPLDELLKKENPYGPQELNYEDCVKGVIAFAPADGSKSIVINSDKLEYMGNDYEIYHVIKNDKHIPKLINVLIHEASHLKGLTLDICYHPLHHGEYLNIEESISDLIENIKNGHIKEKEAFAELTTNYFNSISVYREMAQKLSDGDSLAYLLRNDPSYLATVLLNNADSIALLVRDIYAIYKDKASDAG